MCERFANERAKLTEVFHCPSHPDYGIGSYKCDSFDRKPNPGMLLRATAKHRIDLAHSIMIGDKDSDMQAAHAAGVGIRCHFISNERGEIISSAATHKLDSLHDGISLLTKLATT
jgi:D-glycero-D-manno-heptose 1,7-bisphosphate phosphatase